LPGGIAQLARAGFRSLINNRPDTDQELLMTSAETATEAAANGLRYVHIPVEGRNPLERDVKAFAAALSTLPQPIFAYCHSGGRSASLWAMASVADFDTETLISKCRDIGFDISGLRAKMEMRREMLADGDDDI
jgi:sulfide:quinone oxidoreductase